MIKNIFASQSTSDIDTNKNCLNIETLLTTGMRSLLTILIIILLWPSANSQSLDCSKFRNGTFYYPTVPNKFSVRNGKIQESYINDKLALLWGVEWKSECSFELTCDSIIIDEGYFKVGDKISATIESIDGNCFIVAIIIYTTASPLGKAIPGGKMCLKEY